MAKPTPVPTWATNTNYAASTQPWASTPTKVQPPSGVQNEGINPEDPVVAQYENWLRNMYGQWLAWLNSFSMDVDGSGNLVMDVNKHVIVSGTGAHKRGTRVRHFSAHLGRQVDTSTAMIITGSSGYPGTSAATNVFRIPLTFEQGERITQVDVRVQDSGADVVTAKVWRHDHSGATPSRTQLGGTVTSTGAVGNIETLSIASLTEDVGTQFYDYYVELTCTFTAGCTYLSAFATTTIP